MKKGIDGSPEEELRVIKPEDIVLKAFEYFMTPTLDLYSLIRICIVGGCPSSDDAQALLTKMCEVDRTLSWKMIGGVPRFTRIDFVPGPGSVQ